MQNEFEFVKEVTVRVWSGCERLNRYAKHIAYQNWLRFHDGLGNGGGL